MNALDPALYIKGYTAFAESRFADRSCDLPILDYARFRFSPEREFTDALRSVFCKSAQDYANELINDAHEIRRYLHDASIWKRVLDGFSSDERFLLRFEFVETPTSHALSRPYALKNRFIYCVAMLGVLYQRPTQFSEVTPEHKITYNTMKPLVQDWDGFDEFSVTLAGLNSAEFTKLTDDFRHSDNHRMPARIEMGLMPGSRIHDGGGGKVAFSLGVRKPLKLDAILPPLRDQYLQACRCVEAFWNVVEKREAKWKRAEPKVK